MTAKAKVLIPREEIGRQVARLAAEINRDYQGRDIFIVGVLKGCFVFVADLVRLLDVPVEIDFVALSSYGRGTESSGQVTVTHGLISGVEGKDVLVVEDIVDTGTTTDFFLGYLRTQGPSSLALCTLLDKPARRKVPVSIDYLGFTIPDVFVVGYGLDCDQQLRQLPDICVLEEP